MTKTKTAKAKKIILNDTRAARGKCILYPNEVPFNNIPESFIVRFV